MYQIINGNSLDVLKTLADNSIDSVVTDPPYGLSFMGKSWDYDVPQVELWQEVFRVLKPGGHLLAFAGTRTQHRMAVNIEDAGFEIRDMIAWVYGSGFPKSLNIGKNGGPEGWGTALKPALEPITVARKPIKGSVANNVLKWGTGGINIDGCRVGIETLGGGTMPDLRDVGAMSKEATGIDKLSFGQNPRPAERKEQPTYTGRFPANLIHDGSDEVLGLFPETGKSNPTPRVRGGAFASGGFQTGVSETPMHNDSGSAARFFYCAKASKSERNKGLEGFEDSQRIDYGGFHSEKGLIENNRNPENRTPMKNGHPTVKPVKLMQYLVRLVTPEGGTVLDPFNGSGTTGIACKLEGFDYIGIELDPEYVKISEARIKAWEPEIKQVELV